MKKLMFSCVAVLMAVGFLFSPNQTARAADLIKIGVVDMIKVGSEYDAYQLELKKIQRKKTEMQEVIDKEDKEIAKMVQEFQDEQSNLKKEELEEKKSKIEEKDKKLREYVGGSNQELQDKVTALEEKVKQTIDVIIKEIAERDGLSIVLAKNLTVYSVDDIDITDEVIKKVNQNDQQFLRRSKKDQF